MSAQHIPGPPDGPLGLESISAFRRDPLEFLSRLRREYGDLVRFHFGTTEIYLLGHPDQVREILVDQWDRLAKWERLHPPFLQIAALNLVILEGDAWGQIRRLAAPLFEADRLCAHVDVIAAYAHSMSSCWEDASVRGIDAAMSEVILSVLGEVLFGVRDIVREAPAFAEALDAVQRLFMAEMQAPIHLPDWLPTAENRERRRALQTIAEALRDLIRKRRGNGDDRGDVLSALLRAADPKSGRRLDDEEVVEFALSLFVAGRETPVRALTWAIHLLARNPLVQQRLYQEIQARTAGATVGADDLRQMPYLYQVLHETLRCYPPAWSLVLRQVIQPVRVGTHQLPPGAVVYISSYLLHHDARWWIEPASFDPDRFAAGWEARVPACAYLPFGGGPRTCLGLHLAATEFAVILTTLMQRFRFEPAEEGEEVKAEAGFTLHPRGDIRIRVRRR